MFLVDGTAGAKALRCNHLGVCRKYQEEVVRLSSSSVDGEGKEEEEEGEER